MRDLCKNECEVCMSGVCVSDLCKDMCEVCMSGVCVKCVLGVCVRLNIDLKKTFGF